jgi:tripartite-type tricarboxylate transporter receptor subunit TctC
MRALAKSMSIKNKLAYFPSILKSYISTLILIFYASMIQAQIYPSKPIKMYLPYGPGGIGDLTARVITQKMSENMGQQIIIDNKPSAGGAQAFLSGLQSPADGYTLVMGGNGSAISQSLFKNLPYNILTDFNQVSTMAKFSLVLLVSPDSKYKTVADVIAAGKAKPKSLNFGSVSVGSTQFLAAELFKQMAGIEAQTIPYKVSAGLFTAIRSGEIDVGFEFIPPVLTSIKAGSVKALAIAADKRHPGLQDVPTVDESGLRGYEVTSWNAVSAKTGTPQEIVERLNKEFTSAINSPEVSQSLRKMNSEPFPMSQKETRELMISEIARWKTVIEKANIPLN